MPHWAGESVDGVKELQSAAEIVDELASGAKRLTNQSNDWMVAVSANTSIDIWAKYGMPPNDKSEYLSTALGSGILFEHIPVSH